VYGELASPTQSVELGFNESTGGTWGGALDILRNTAKCVIVEGGSVAELDNMSDEERMPSLRSLQIPSN